MCTCRMLLELLLWNRTLAWPQGSVYYYV